MTFANTIRVDQHLRRARLLADGETVEVTLFQAAQSATPAAGWAVTVAGSAVAISAGEIDDDGLVLLTIPATTGDQAVKLSYDPLTGSIMGDDFELAAFTNRAVANFSEYVVPTPGQTGYPLDDDGTLAALFGFGSLTMTAPDYNEGEHVYTGTTTGGTALGLPAAENYLTDQAFVVGADTVLHIEFEPIVPSCYEAGVQGFPLLGLGLIMSTGGVFGGVFGTIGIHDDDGSTPIYRGSLISDTVRTTVDGPVRMSVDIDGTNSTVTVRTTDDDTIVSATSFTPGTAFTAYLFVSDGGAPLAGNVVISLVPKAADAALPCNPGAVDLLNVEV